jgi:two-component system sensor histidine kinase LytS
LLSPNAVNVVLSAVTAGLLLLVAWGVAEGNVIASMLSGAGLAVVIVAFGTINLVPDTMRAEATERTLAIASETLRSCNHGLTPDNAARICRLLLPETAAVGIAVTNTKKVLAYEGEHGVGTAPGSQNTVPTLEVLESKRMETFVSMDDSNQTTRRFNLSQNRSGRAFGIIVPLLVKDEPMGTIKLYYRSGTDIDRTQLAIAKGFGELLSTQLSSYELDRQAELLARAEVKALQAQINPHFLFNTLNTIASLTRTDPTKARDLLREFSIFYRRTLEGTDQLIPLSRELEQTRRYLKIEKARFGEDRIVEEEFVEPGCASLSVPSFLVQPVVENSVRHAMREEGALHIDIHVAVDGNDVLVAVTDDGLGMDQQTADKLLEAASKASGDEKGTGIALKNVAERVERFYGAGSGVEIISKPGEGTCVTLRLGEAALTLHHEAKG